MTTPQRIILCVDDDPDDQMMVRETIQAIEPNAHIILAANGQEGIAYLEKATKAELPCLIIMDINMPYLDGKETLVRLKKEGKFASIPVVMFTTSSSKLDKTFFEQHNIPFLTKPISQSELHILVSKMLTFASCQ